MADGPHPEGRRETWMTIIFMVLTLLLVGIVLAEAIWDVLRFPGAVDLAAFFRLVAVGLLLLSMGLLVSSVVVWLRRR